MTQLPESDNIRQLLVDFMHGGLEKTVIPQLDAIDPKRIHTNNLIAQLKQVAQDFIDFHTGNFEIKEAAIVGSSDAYGLGGHNDQKSEDTI